MFLFEMVECLSAENRLKCSIVEDYILRQLEVYLGGV